MRSILILFFFLCITYNFVKGTLTSGDLPDKTISRHTILAVGKTGFGKSFTATLFGFDATVGDNSNSTTKKVTIHQNEEYVYIDTPGLDDSDVTVKDEATIVNILSEMQAKDITEVHTIFWFVREDIKATRSLQEQARFIESLNDNNKASNIWNNVIVVHKGLDEDFNETAVKDAIKKVNHHADLTKTHLMAVKLYHTLKPNSRLRNQDKVSLHESGIYEVQELPNIYQNIMREKHHAKNPVRIVFKDDKCVKCGIKGDRRLTWKFPCHVREKQRHDKDEYDNDLMESYEVHTGRYKHPGNLVTELDEGWEKARDIVGIIPVLNILTFIPEIGLKASKSKMWSCCGGNQGSEGCESITSQKQRHTCCRKDKGAPGCKKLCSNCNRAWGNSEGCSRHEKHQYLD